MVKISSIFVFGLLVAIMPYTGFTKGTKTFLYVILGLLIALLSLLIRRELHEVLRHLHGDEKQDTFTQSVPKEKRKIQ